MTDQRETDSRASSDDPPAALPARMTLKAAMEHYDASNRDRRAERSRWLAQFDRPSFYVLRLDTSTVLHEAGACFIHGFYAATVLLATAFVEHALTDMLVARRKMQAGEKRNLEAIIDLAGKAGLLDAEQLGLAHDVRAIRNPYAHRRPLTGEGAELSLPARFMAAKCHPSAILEDDAKRALAIMFPVFERYTLGS